MEKSENEILINDLKKVAELYVETMNKNTDPKIKIEVINLLRVGVLKMIQEIEVVE